MPDNASTDRFNPDDQPTMRGLGVGRKIFGRYVLEAEVGRGGMGVVWRTRDDELGELVALKFLPEVVVRDEAAVDELRAETRHARRLTHANIVRIHDFVRDEVLAALSMEFVDGMTLSRLRLEQSGKVFSTQTLAPLVAQLCEALDYAHSRAKVVHRDLKPANLLVTRDGQLKVTDFGIARSLSDTHTRLTGRAGDTSGTLVFMSPQQLLGAKPTPADDIYALGATLYDLLTGKPPFFSGDIATQVRTLTPPPLAARRAELEVVGEPIPREWQETIAACLAKEPQDRPQTAGEVSRRLGFAPQQVEPDLRAGSKSDVQTVSPQIDQHRGRHDGTAEVAGATQRRPAGTSTGRETSASRRRLRYRYPTPEEAAREAKQAAAGAEAPARPAWQYSTRRKGRRTGRRFGWVLVAAALGGIGVYIAGLTPLPRPWIENPGRASAGLAAPEGPRGPRVGQPWTIAGLGLVMLPVPAGTFTMGSPVDETGRDNDEGPQMVVTISKPFWLGRTEVTQAQWQAVSGNNPSFFRGAERPVENVSWNEAMDFCRTLTERELAAGRIPRGYVYTLPTEAQWEYACRAGNAHAFAGDSDSMAWYDSNSGGGTHPVGHKQPNQWGLYDMEGNVWEWCLDYYGSYPGGRVVDPAGPENGSSRVVRGGSWNFPVDYCRAARRGRYVPSKRCNFVGLRVALTPAQK